MSYLRQVSAAARAVIPRLTLAVVLGASAACQDAGNNPDLWTVNELHQDLGLVGGHRQLDCQDCHAESATRPLAGACEDCHLDLYEQATDPDHPTAGFGTACAECHDPHAWRPSFYDHSSFGFALEGAHARVVCAGCHPAGSPFGELPDDCWSCHESDYASANPDHAALEFGRQCQDCHSTINWHSDTFDHDATNFALRGAHLDAACADCHAGGFQETSADCAACHADDEPRDHFGQDCRACHTEDAWEPSTFDHESDFPLQRGDHRKYRNDCAACHLEPANYASYTCTDCHDGEHERRDMDREHDEVRNYRYDSVACYDCHPRGSEEDAEGGDD